MNPNTAIVCRPGLRPIQAIALVALFALTGTRVVADTSAIHAVIPGKDAQIEGLIKAMTLEEKLGQLTQQWGGEFQDVNPGINEQKENELKGLVREGLVGSFLGAHGAAYTNRLQKVAHEESRHGIPIILGNDVIHGYRTIFPIPLGLASSWEPIAYERASRVAAAEARGSGTHWTFAPMIDVCRDPRWGRIAETAGEDPYLGSVMAAAQVRGFQGENISAPDAVVACAKHFVAYGGAEAGRDYNTVDISLQTLREVHLPPFEAAVDAGVGTIMTAFNEISGIPCSASPFILRQILRGEWGFRGMVVSDWTSVTEMVVHGYCRDDADAAAQAIAAGVDMDMSSFSYRTHLVKAVAAGVITEDDVNAALRNVLKMKKALGLFDNPYTDEKIEKKVILSKENRAIARDVSRQSIVLLKNEGNLLPLKPEIKSLAVIGPLADNGKDPLGTWAGIGKPEDVITVLAGIKERVSKDTKIHYAKGSDILTGSDADRDAAVKLAKDCDAAVLVIGESENMSGEGHSRAFIDIPEAQRNLLKAVHKSGVPVVAVLMSGRPLSTQWASDNIPAILNTWHLGVECGHAIADVLFGDFNPGGKMPVTVPRTVGQVPIHYNHKNTGRPPKKDVRYTSKYIDVPFTPLYPFGYGLSYTTFAFSNLKLSADKIGRSGSFSVSVTIKNTGDRKGDEVAQLYIRDLVASMTRPVKELKGFKRITLDPGGEQTVTFKLGPKQLGFYDRHGEYVVEPGAFKLWVGPNSAEGLEGSFEVTP